jgi:hypothetical protein
LSLRLNRAKSHENVQAHGGIPFLTSALERSDYFHIPVTLPLTEGALYTLDRRLCGPRAGLNMVVKKTFLPLPGIKLQLSRPQPITILIAKLSSKMKLKLHQLSKTAAQGIYCNLSHSTNHAKTPC